MLLDMKYLYTVLCTDSCLESDGMTESEMMKNFSGLVWLHCPISYPIDASRYAGMWLDLTTTHQQTWPFSSTSTYHLTDLLTARGITHLVVHGTTGSTSYETIPPAPLESSGGVLSTVDMVRDQPNSRFHGLDIFRVIGLLPWKTLISVKSVIFLRILTFLLSFSKVSDFISSICADFAVCYVSHLSTK